MLKSALYIVPTPIGNLSDITLRAVEVLKSATLIAAEDTRHSKILLDHLGVFGTKLISCHDHNEEEKAQIIANEVKQGGIVALISDAGSPLINDPGYRVVTYCANLNVDVVPLPGPCALITALEGAALPTDKFMFRGFFPVKEKELKEVLVSLTSVDYTAVFYETPKRILATADALSEILPDHPVALCRELTKAYESFYRMKASQLPEFLRDNSDRTKGEFVVVIGSVPKTNTDIPSNIKEALTELIKTTPVKTACSALALACNLKRNELYELALKLKEK